MRICFISFEYPPNLLGGAGTYAGTIVNGLRARGVDTFVITRGNGQKPGRETFTVPVINAPYSRRFFFMKPALNLLHELSKNWEFDLVHFNEPHILLKKLSLPTICTVHSTQINEINLLLAHWRTLNRVDIRDMILKIPVGSISDFLTAHLTDRIICPSANLAGLVKSYSLVDEEKISVIRNGIDLQAFDSIQDDETVLRNYDLAPGNYLLFVGRLSVLKGVHYLIKAFRDIRKECSNVKLVIVGTGDLENNLRSLAQETKEIVFTGYLGSLKDRKTLYRNSLAVVVPSIYDALPMVVLEAMACGKAIIASDVGDIHYLINHQQSGFLTTSGDVKSLEKFMKILCQHEDLRKEMGLFGRKLVERKFTMDKMVDETLRVYESVLT